jgi:hypothetical protein
MAGELSNADVNVPLLKEGQSNAYPITQLLNSNSVHYHHVPRTSDDRRRASLADRPIDVPKLLQQNSLRLSVSDATVLYLAYGSNLSAETFRGKRGIQPLSQINVLVPELTLTFNLRGVPYSEPCFGNTRYREPEPSTLSEKTPASPHPSDYHKNRWHKGLVGVVYEVTLADFAHIIATEGGGASYQDVLVSCFALSSDPKEPVPTTPTGTPFKAHTLFAPERNLRPDPSYAQPSPRYLKLITDGAAELGLPFEYQDFLHQIRTYRPTSTKQMLGHFFLLTTFVPAFAFIFGGARVLLDRNGRYPKWFARLSRAIFVAVWASYDHFFKGIFGDGERTQEAEEGEGKTEDVKRLLEDATLLEYGTGERRGPGMARGRRLEEV